MYFFSDRMDVEEFPNKSSKGDCVFNGASKRKTGNNTCKHFRKSLILRLEELKGQISFF